MMRPLLSAITSSLLLVAALSSSTTYQLQSYGIGSGGTNNAASPTYTLNGSSGELSGNSSGTSDASNGGRQQAQQANVPTAPTLSNGSGTYYNKLNLTITTSSTNPTDYTYAIAVSTNGFATTSYMQADGTLGSSPVFQTYSAWGGSSGSFMIGLTANTTYQAKVSARQGTFSQSAYGPVGSATTANPSVSFSLSPNTLNLGSLLPGSVVTSSTVSLNMTTNAASGALVYMIGQNGGLVSGSQGTSIASASADLSSVSSGFGAMVTATSQSSGGPLTSVSPYNGTGSVVGAVATNYNPLLSTSTLVSGGAASLVLKAKASTTTPAASDYQETVTLVVAPSF